MPRDVREQDFPRWVSFVLAGVRTSQASILLPGARVLVDTQHLRDDGDRPQLHRGDCDGGRSWRRDGVAGLGGTAQVVQVVQAEV